MKWLLCLVILFLCVISGLLGLTAGINLNPVSTVKFVPQWGSLGDWVSGLGALLAVLVTLWLADKSRREDVESLDIKCSMALVGSYPKPLLVIEATSNGKRDAHVSGVYFASPKAKTNYWLVRYNHLSTRLPAHLAYGKRAMLIADDGTIKELAEFVRDHAGGDPSGLNVQVNTTLKEFGRALHPDIVQLINDELRKL